MTEYDNEYNGVFPLTEARSCGCPRRPMRVLLHPSYLSIALQLRVQHVNLVAHEKNVLAHILCDGCSRFAGKALAELDITVYSMELCSLSAFSRHRIAIS